MCQEENESRGICYAFCFLPLALYVYGWFDKGVEYDKVEIYDGKNKIGEAEEGIERHNVLLHYGNKFNFEKGWRCYVDRYKEADSAASIYAVAVKNGKREACISVQVKGVSVQNVFSCLAKHAEAENNVLVIPGASNKIPMLNEIARRMKNYNFIVLLEAVPEDRVVSRQELMQMVYDQYGIQTQESNLHVYIMPLLFVRNKFMAKKTVTLEETDQGILRKNEWLNELSDVIREKFPNMEKSYSQYYVCKFYDFIDLAMSYLKIRGIMLWNQFFVLHDIIKHIGETRKLPIIYSESGVLPGTLAFETLGQMGESMPAVQYEEFKGLGVSAEELAQAQQILEYMYESKLNRWGKYNVYKKDQLKTACSEIMPGRPIIFYAGQNDYESGIKPYTATTKECHSPIFKSSYEAAVALGEICKKNEWNLIYKRHPMMRREKAREILPSNIINFDELEIHDIIDFSDVTITILSQTAYVALIRNKPVVMLGYNQLRGKGCVYEAFDIEKIEDQISCALKFGRTQAQKQEFILHAAQLLKYYLFNDMNEKTHGCYGRNQDELVSYIDQKLKGDMR